LLEVARDPAESPETNGDVAVLFPFALVDEEHLAIGHDVVDEQTADF
jgi:hypothetical protein